MSTIDGLKIHIKAEELREHLLTRVTFHSEKADYYGRRYAADKDLRAEEEMAAGYSNSMARNIADSEKTHRARAAYFKFMADHLVEGVTYILDKDDVNMIEISA